MRKMRGGLLFAAAVAAALASGGVSAQTTPADPFAPGAAAENAAPEPEKPAAKSSPDKTSADSSPDAAGKTAPRRAKPKPHPAEGGALTVVVNNKRLVGLVQLTIGPAGGEAKKVAGPLAFGRKVSVHVKRTKDCLYDVRGQFADEADTEQLGVDLCKDKVINLTDE